MSTNPKSTRFALFPQEAADEQGRRPVIRRYTLARLAPAPGREGQDRKSTHD
jgi:hypothetical protein